MIQNGIQVAVRAAEQAGLSGQLAGGGGAKKQYAVKAAQDFLDRAGVKINVDQIATLIESEVRSQFNNAAPPVDTPETRSALIDKAVQAAVLAAEQSGIKQTAVNLGAGLARSKKG